MLWAGIDAVWTRPGRQRLRQWLLSGGAASDAYLDDARIADLKSAAEDLQRLTLNEDVSGLLDQVAERALGEATDGEVRVLAAAAAPRRRTCHASPHTCGCAPG